MVSVFHWTWKLISYSRFTVTNIWFKFLYFRAPVAIEDDIIISANFLIRRKQKTDLTISEQRRLGTIIVTSKTVNSSTLIYKYCDVLLVKNFRTICKIIQVSSAMILSLSYLDLLVLVLSDSARVQNEKRFQTFNYFEYKIHILLAIIINIIEIPFSSIFKLRFIGL